MAKTRTCSSHKSLWSAPGMLNIGHCGRVSDSNQGAQATTQTSTRSCVTAHSGHVLITWGSGTLDRASCKSNPHCDERKIRICAGRKIGLWGSCSHLIRNNAVVSAMHDENGAANAFDARHVVERNRVCPCELTVECSKEPWNGKQTKRAQMIEDCNLVKHVQQRRRFLRIKRVTTG